MSDYCTCGAELPPDARFCHKCGKPQREELVIVEEPPAAPPPPPPVAAPIPIGFRNPLAFRVGFLSALMALLLTFLLTPGLPLWLTAAGFLGVYLYRARSGETFSTRNGARMGWLTGVLAFLVFALPAVLGWRAIVASPEFVALMRQQWSSLAIPAASQNQTLAFMQTPVGMAWQVVVLLVLLFIMVTLFSLLGGVVAAKVLGRK